MKTELITLPQLEEFEKFQHSTGLRGMLLRAAWEKQFEEDKELDGTNIYRAKRAPVIPNEHALLLAKCRRTMIKGVVNLFDLKRGRGYNWSGTDAQVQTILDNCNTRYWNNPGIWLTMVMRSMAKAMDGEEDVG